MTDYFVSEIVAIRLHRLFISRQIAGIKFAHKLLADKRALTQQPLVVIVYLLQLAGLASHLIHHTIRIRRFTRASQFELRVKRTEQGL